MNNLPSVEKASFEVGEQSLLLTCEGFEERSLFFTEKLPEAKPQGQIFNHCIIIKYLPVRNDHGLEKIRRNVTMLSISEPQVFDFNRYEPQEFETSIINYLSENMFDEIVLDISVMSKMVIMVVMQALADYPGKLRIIYSEANDYCPSHEEFIAEGDLTNNRTLLPLPSEGVHGVVSTSALSSTLMQGSPSLMIAFCSFNEELIRALLSNSIASRLILINGYSPRESLSWRQMATQGIHQNIIEEFSSDNRLDDNNNLKRKVSAVDYRDTVRELLELYKQHCFNYRLILAPTGSKMQAVGCGIVKLCCPDMHIEYPTPESFSFRGYSKGTFQINEVLFNDFANETKNLRQNLLKEMFASTPV